MIWHKYEKGRFRGRHERAINRFHIRRVRAQHERNIKKEMSLELVSPEILLGGICHLMQCWVFEAVIRTGLNEILWMLAFLASFHIKWTKLKISPLKCSHFLLCFTMFSSPWPCHKTRMLSQCPKQPWTTKDASIFMQEKSICRERSKW